MAKKMIPPETAQEVLYDALSGGDVKSIARLLNLLDQRKLYLALRRLKYQRKKKGGSMEKIEEYMEGVFINTAKVSWDKNGKRHIRLINTNKVVGYVVSYYFSNSVPPTLKGKIKKSASLVRMRIFLRLYRMSEGEIQKKA
jgi:hypothetical protein